MWGRHLDTQASLGRASATRPSDELIPSRAGPPTVGSSSGTHSPVCHPFGPVSHSFALCPLGTSPKYSAAPYTAG